MLKWNYTYDEKKNHTSIEFALNAQQANFFCNCKRKTVYLILAPLFSFNIPPLLGATFSDLDRGESDLIYSLH